MYLPSAAGQNWATRGPNVTFQNQLLSCKQEDAFCSLFGFKLEPNKIISSLLLDY